MSLITTMRRQDAIYWPPRRADDFGREGHGPPVELTLLPTVNYRVRWEDRIEEFMDAEGTTRTSRAVVYVPRLPDGSEVEVGGFLWLGARTDLTDEAEPMNNEGAYEVRRMDKFPDFHTREFLRTAYL